MVTTVVASKAAAARNSDAIEKHPAVVKIGWIVSM